MKCNNFFKAKCHIHGCKISMKKLEYISPLIKPNNLSQSNYVAFLVKWPDLPFLFVELKGYSLASYSCMPYHRQLHCLHISITTNNNIKLAQDVLWIINNASVRVEDVVSHRLNNCLYLPHCTYSEEISNFDFKVEGKLPLSS